MSAPGDTPGSTAVDARAADAGDGGPDSAVDKVLDDAVRASAQAEADELRNSRFAQARAVWGAIRAQARDRRRATLITLGAAFLVTASCLLLVIGAYTNDFKITARPGVAAAEVMSASYNRTVVRFSTPDSAVRVPRDGVLYPGGLQVGQVVRVEYDQANPDLVRVAGRGAWLTLVPAITIVLVVWAVAGGVLWWLHRRREPASVADASELRR
ncbi:DUF3592 domain-containing protein [Allokutzneria albata]|uniref:DUF3592 domain-containing protein n=1 Tax=Allokutzneria albata TaxID=211114 RepID=A0A1G9Z2U6_ALLAB|nr:DUF3592 domain-containing protein [Allokutzneria albata]SDN15742.1 hypothetical protein SAMN04489726_5233 [Allokutzneria albata]